MSVLYIIYYILSYIKHNRDASLENQRVAFVRVPEGVQVVENVIYL